MLLPIHEKLQQIDKIDLEKNGLKGEISILYTYRNQVIAHIDSLCKKEKAIDQDYVDIVKWFEINSSDVYWSLKKRQNTPIEMANYIINNALNKIQDTFIEACGVPSSSELEDVLHFVESFILAGSEKQTAWAHSIMEKNLNAIALHLRTNISIPHTAKWWIENRHSILIGLKNENTVSQ